MGTMANFFGQLNAGCGCNLGAAGETVDAVVAVQRMLQRYAELSTYGERLRQIIAGGVQVPCDVWEAYNQACLDYMGKGQDTFSQLAQHGVVVDQIVYSGGQPVADPGNPTRFKTVRVSAPLRPPSFTFIATQCPGVATFQGGGWEPFPIEGSLPMTLLGAASSADTIVALSASTGLIGMVGYATYTVYKQIAIWRMEFNNSPTQTLKAYTACVSQQTANGATATVAGQRCADVQTRAQQAALERQKAQNGGGWSLTTWLMVLGGVLVAGGALTLYLRGRLVSLAPRFGEPPRRARRRRRRQPQLLGRLYLE